MVSLNLFMLVDFVGYERLFTSQRTVLAELAKARSEGAEWPANFEKMQQLKRF